MLLAVVLTSVVSQAPVEHRAQAWLMSMAQATFATKGLAYVEIQPRVFVAPNARLDQVLLRAAVGYQLHPRVSVWLGAAHVPVWSTPDVNVVSRLEARFFQQALWIQAFGAVKLLGRARFEQRLMTIDGVSLRLRAQLRAQWLFADPFMLIVADEVFFTLNTVPNAPAAGVDQNRGYVALGFVPYTKIILELGYLNQLVRTNAQGDLRMGHTAMLTTAFGF